MASPVGKCPATLVTQKGSIASVHSAMPIQSVFPAKTPSAFRTLELLLLVVEPRVDQQVAGPFERLSADLALVRPLVHVRSDVSFERALVRERFVAHEADEDVRRVFAALQS